METAKVDTESRAGAGILGTRPETLLPMKNIRLTPYVVTIPAKRGKRRIMWNRFASYAGAVATVRGLRAKGVDARIEGLRV